MTFDVMAKKCDECLMSPQKIVSNARRKQILADCREADNHFICHKGTIEGARYRLSRPLRRRRRQTWSLGYPGRAGA